MKNFKSKWVGLSLAAITILSSCNSEFDKVIPAAPGNGTDLQYKAPKVLYIIADGARGASVRDGDAPNVKSLITNAIYSWNSLADDNTSHATNWANMLTGVGKAKHNVLSEDFAGNALADYPSIFARIKGINPKLRIATFAASAAFKDRLTQGTDVSESLGNDVAVKNRMVEFLKTDTAAIVLGQFHGIDLAGAAGEYDIRSAGYKAAITTFDTQLGEILATVKARPTYAKENWLIIVTSNKGGQFTLPAAQDDKTVFSNTNLNTFTIIHNKDYKPTFIAKPFVGNLWSGNSPRFLGDPERSTGLVSAVNSAALFNFGDTSSFTISVKVKKRKNPSNVSRGDYYYQYPSFLGKRVEAGWGTGKPGWDFCFIRNHWRFFAAGGTGWGDGTEIFGLEVTGDTWHDLTAVVERRPNGRTYVRVYTDGVLGVSNQPQNQLVGGAVTGTVAAPIAREIELAGTPNFNNNAQMRVGHSIGEIDGNFGKIDVNVAELKIFRFALPDAVVKQYACDPTMDSSHPYYDYVLGYWHLNEGSG
ncbi:MAG: hypothetical protein EOO92_12490, partial [Pedobacter sp.]